MPPVIAGQGTFTRVHKGSSVNIFRLAWCHLIQKKKDSLCLMNGERRGISPPLFTHTNTFTPDER